MTHVVAAALVFTVVVFAHELGHFLAARWAGVQVQVFSIGLGPILFRLRRGATEYRVSALPIGGYVRLAGLRIFDDPADSTPTSERFRSRSRLARLGIYLAGPAASVALGLLLLTISFSSGAAYRLAPNLCHCVFWPWSRPVSRGITDCGPATRSGGPLLNVSLTGMRLANGSPQAPARTLSCW